MSLSGLIPLISGDLPLWNGESGTKSPDHVPSFAARRGVRPLYVASLWQKSGRPVLVVTPRADDSRSLHDQLITYCGESARYFSCPNRRCFPLNGWRWTPAPLTSGW